MIAAFLGMEFTHATYLASELDPLVLAGEWHPLGNDSFYHARRILDAVDSPRGFYQFDKNIHAPEGSWLTWPWGYDYFMAKFVQVWQFFSPATDSMEIITHTAIYWIFINSALLLGITVVLNLPTSLAALVMLAFALSPLTQSLHGVGIIDHHYVEYTFVLATILAGLAWLKQPASLARASALGITLGLAPAFHTGLFILQAPVLAVLFLLWIQHKLPPKESMIALSCALMLAMLVAVIPAEPFQLGQFQFSVLSWFHLYIAATSTLFIACMAHFSFSLKHLIGFCVAGALLLIPIWQDTIGGAAFLSQKITLLSTISEAQSPYRMITTKPGFWKTMGYYSFFGLVIPLLIPLFLLRAWKSRSGMDIFLAVMMTFGVGLLLTQYRLNYFGSFALVLGWCVLLTDKFDFVRTRQLPTFLLGLLIVILAYIPSVDNVLFNRYALGWDDRYQESLPLFDELEKACERKHGIVLVDNNFAHMITYRATCSVIANNFLMTPQHEQKIHEMWEYMDLSPEQLLEKKPKGMRYVFARMSSYLQVNQDGSVSLTSTETMQKNNFRLMYELNSRDDLPARYKYLGDIPLDPDRNLTRAVLYEILDEDDPSLQ
jgi:asparagine N-glycosylation enzyme membrane subunit Stt3